MTQINQDVATEFEVAPTMHMDNSRDPIDERPGVDEKLPFIEKHITKIPQYDDPADGDVTSESHSSGVTSTSDGSYDKGNLKENLKKYLPGQHTSEPNTGPEETHLTNQDSGSSEFEIAGFMPMTSLGSSESASGISNENPNLERHISSIPQKDNDVDGEEE